MSNLLTRVETYLLSILNPLVGQVTSGDFRVEGFDSPENIAALLGKFRDETPSGFLSIPTVTIEKPDSTTRISGVSMEYGVLIGYAMDRETSDTSRARAYRDFDLIAGACFYKRPNPAEFPPSVGYFDFVRPSRWQFVHNENMSVALFNFSVRIARWNIIQQS